LDPAFNFALLAVDSGIPSLACEHDYYLMKLTKGRRINVPTSEISVDMACGIPLLIQKDSLHMSTTY
jgi:hypothetical protein